LAVITLSAAVAIEQLIFKNKTFAGESGALKVPPPEIGGKDFGPNNTNLKVLGLKANDDIPPNVWFGVLWSAGIVAGLALMAGVAIRRSRTAAGSAAYLKTESFRRFLAASEARHVEEAWKRGVIREYTAWAVALGEADAWRRAARSVAEPAVMAAVTSASFGTHRYFSTARTHPSSSGSGSSGGGVGSGGGGGRSGSW
jgi:uncharacterized membrane protein